jgi:tetratricopeptide (TPR) repeat protein
LALVCDQQGHYEEAERYCRRAVAIWQSTNSDNFNASNAMNNLAALLAQQGQIAEAALWYEQALTSSQRLLGRDHPFVGQVLLNFAALMRQGNKDREARQMEVRGQSILAKHRQRNLLGLSIDLGKLSRDSQRETDNRGRREKLPTH